MNQCESHLLVMHTGGKLAARIQKDPWYKAVAIRFATLHTSMPLPQQHRPPTAIGPLQIYSAQSVENFFLPFILELSGWGLVAPSCFED